MMCFMFVGCFYRDKKNSKFIDMDFDNCINKFNKNDLSLDNLSLNAVPLSAKISTMYIPFDKEEMSTDAVPGLPSIVFDRPSSRCLFF